MIVFVLQCCFFLSSALQHLTFQAYALALPNGLTFFYYYYFFFQIFLLHSWGREGEKENDDDDA